MKQQINRDDAFTQNIESLEVRKARSAADAPVAAKEYADNAKGALDRMARLKAERLAREKLSASGRQASHPQRASEPAVRG
jgi:hypothetical protein